MLDLLQTTQVKYSRRLQEIIFDYYKLSKKCFEIEYNMIFGIKRIHHTSNLYKLFTNNGTSVQKLLHYCRTLVFLGQTSFICIFVRTTLNEKVNEK